MYRDAGGTRAVLANIFTDLRQPPVGLPISHVPKISLLCSKQEARDRLKRLEDLGIDDALLVCPWGDTAQLEQIADLRQHNPEGTPPTRPRITLLQRPRRRPLRGLICPAKGLGD